jgi:glycosyltransferase involved in cell wall biosynthesis
MAIEFNPTPTKDISILLPTRARPELLMDSLESLVETADDNSKIEYLIAVDDDDQATIDYVNNYMLSWFEDRDIDLTVFAMPRLGYGRLNEYVNFLGAHSNGAWLIFWNDDARMISKGWDTEVISKRGQLKIFRFKDNHDEHPYAIFPIIPREWYVLFECCSPQQQSDAWISQVGYLCNAVERLETEVIHDRADLTGNNDDEVYQTRVYHEGNIDNPLDLNHPKFHILKQHYAAKWNWLMNMAGQGNGFWESVQSGQVNPWEKMLANDPNGQIAVTAIPKEKIEQYGS